MSDRNIISWHYVTGRDGQPTGLRGWDKRIENRYELVQEVDGTWGVSFVSMIGQSEWGFYRIHGVTLFECMVAAEKHADELYALATEDGED